MGDWRTLHFFDEDRYIQKIVPLVKNGQDYITSFSTDYRLKWFDSFNIDRKEIINQTVDFITELSYDLRIHSELKRIDERKTNESFNQYIQRSTSELGNFRNSKKYAIEAFEFLLIETIFSTVSNFNPYFSLGKGIFESYVKTKKDSIAQELCNRIVSQEQGSILDMIDGGIINWLSKR